MNRVEDPGGERGRTNENTPRGITTQKELWIAGEDPLDGKPTIDGH
jgi:hypothetical protein